MRRTVLVVCIIIAASLVAAGQRRRVGIPRPERGQPTASQPEPASTPAPATAPSAGTAPGQQTYKSAIEFQSLMQLRFYENQGGFLVEGLEVVFPPAGSRKATFIITRAGGAAVASVPLRLETPLASYTAFGMFKPDGV